mmetsp:Transcript_53464/g.140613  ORF Transcript_53464/g.140613 Transcript_53464/m.140613 type:complete len:248 (+) Transcript_53464:145-888(+)
MQKRHVCVSCFRRVLHHVALVVALGELHVVLLHALALEVCLELEHRAQLDIEPLGDRVGDDALVCRVEDGDEQVEQHKVGRRQKGPEEDLHTELGLSVESLEHVESGLAAEPDGHFGQDARVGEVKVECGQLVLGHAVVDERVEAVSVAEEEDAEQRREAQCIVAHRDYGDEQRAERARKGEVREQPQRERHLEQPHAKGDPRQLRRHAGGCGDSEGGEGGHGEKVEGIERLEGSELPQPLGEREPT